MRKFFAILAFLAMSVASAQIPDAPVSRVTDTTGQFTQAQVEALSTKLKGLEDKNGSQILVYVSDKIPGGMPIEDFANQASRKWRVGSSKSNYAAVYFVFKTDHKTRIEVARGLEGAMTDTATKHIQESVKPLLRAGNWYGGVNQVVDQMVGLASTEPVKVAPTQPHATVTVQAEEDMSWVGFVLGLALIVLVLAIVFRVRRKMLEEAEEDEEDEEEVLRYRRAQHFNEGCRGTTVFRESESEVDPIEDIAAEIVRHHPLSSSPWGSSSSSDDSSSSSSSSDSSWSSSSDSGSSSDSSWSSSSDSGSSFDGGGSSSDF